MAGVRIPKRVQDRLIAGLRKYQPIVRRLRERDISEADTVTVVKDMLSDIFGYDKYSELTSEQQIRGTFCDLAIKAGDKIHYLAEVKVGAESPQSLLRKILFTKASAWRYENEWRLIHYKGRPGPRILNEGILDGIILGLRTASAVEKTIINSIKRSGRAIEAFRAIEDREDYRLVIERISLNC